MPSIFDIGSEININFSSDMILMVRAIIGDLDEVEYTDEKILSLIFTASKIVLSDINKSHLYTVYYDSTIIGYTPMIDDDLISLIVLKSACLVVNAESRYMASISGIRATCSDATIATSSGDRLWSILFDKGPCQAYENLKIEMYKRPLMSGRAFKAILSPYLRYHNNNCGGDRSC
jgi:hypothetical protein